MTKDLHILSYFCLCKGLQRTGRHKTFILHNINFHNKCLRLKLSPLSSDLPEKKTFCKKRQNLNLEFSKIRWMHVHKWRVLEDRHTVKKNYEIPEIFFDQTFRGLGLGRLFPATESLVSDIPAGDGKSLNLYLQCTLPYCKFTHAIPRRVPQSSTRMA